MDVVFQAAFELRPLRCLYPSPSDGAPERIAIHPYALLLYKDALHCLGLDVGRGAVRSFLIEHMRDAACEPKRHFALPASFRVEDFCQGQFGIWRGGDPVQVVVDLDARVAGHVESRQVHPSERREPLPDGGLRLRFTIGDLSEVTSWVLGFGAMARVVSPPELRARVRAELLRAVEQYSPAPAVSAQKANAAGRLPDGVRTLAHDRARRQALPSRPRR
ncbi:MAG: WYL domain-containing protein [Deltaproteobacteria bacterium]|nr:WYL domain-containing protein [Deltaproteobacteria bacterium]